MPGLRVGYGALRSLQFAGAVRIGEGEPLTDAPSGAAAQIKHAYARTATQALNNVTQRWITLLADHGVAGACRIRKEVLGAVNCSGGKLTCPPVGEAHGIPVVDAAELLGI